MKKIVLTSLILCSLFVSLNARTKIKRSGSADGVNYRIVNETHTWFNHTLTCANPGPTRCGWTEPHRVVGINGEYLVTDIESFVNEKIASGETSGNTYYGETGILVVWTSNEYDVEIEITDYEG